MTRKFVPRASLQSGHKMTLFSWGNPRYFTRLPAPLRRYFDVDDDARALMAEDHREQAFGIAARARELVGVADARRLDLDQHLAELRSFQVDFLDL